MLPPPTCRPSAQSARIPWHSCVTHTTPSHWRLHTHLVVWACRLIDPVHECFELPQHSTAQTAHHTARQLQAAAAALLVSAIKHHGPGLEQRMHSCIKHMLPHTRTQLFSRPTLGPWSPSSLTLPRNSAACIISCRRVSLRSRTGRNCTRQGAMSQQNTTSCEPPSGMVRHALECHAHDSCSECVTWTITATLLTPETKTPADTDLEQGLRQLDAAPATT